MLFGVFGYPIDTLAVGIIASFASTTSCVNLHFLSRPNIYEVSKGVSGILSIGKAGGFNGMNPHVLIIANKLKKKYVLI